MKPTADYFTAAIPEPWQILGLRLKSFSLGHYRILKRFKCAFVDDETSQVTREDLIFGVLVCSMTPKEFMQLLNEGDLVGEAQKWGEKCGLFDLNEKAQLFKDYIDAHSVVPPYWEGEEGKPSGAHWAQCVESTLRSKLGWTDEEIDTQPLSKAFADYFKQAENDGMIKLMTPDEIKLTEAQCPD